jgi:hypothetical protein
MPLRLSPAGGSEGKQRQAQNAIHPCSPPGDIDNRSGVRHGMILTWRGRLLTIASKQTG